MQGHPLEGHRYIGLVENDGEKRKVPLVWKRPPATLSDTDTDDIIALSVVVYPCLRETLCIAYSYAVALVMQHQAPSIFRRCAPDRNISFLRRFYHAQPVTAGPV